jgi:DNA-binding CsgD family transcriptional regulator
LGLIDMKPAALDPALLETIGLIYDSALNHALWPSALEAMCKHIDGCSGAILVHDMTRQEIRGEAEWCNLPDWPKWRKLLDDKYAPMMPFYGALAQHEIGEVYNTAQMAAMIGRGADIYQEPFFVEWALPAGLRDNIASVLIRNQDRFATFALHTSTQHELIGPEKLAIGRLLAPHVWRAVIIGDLLDLTVATAGTLQQTLDKLSAAVMVTDHEARVMHANSAGHALLSSGAPLSLVDGQLSAPDPAATRALQNAIAQTQGSPHQLGNGGINIPLRYPDGKAAIAQMLPLGYGHQRRDWEPRAAAAIFVATAGYALPASDSLIALYGLTNMEARVVEQIADGNNRGASATALGIADSTVKSHLERIFKKTGTRDQGELVRLIGSLRSPVSAA